MSANEHDFTRQRWGHAVGLWETKDEGIHVEAMGHGGGLARGDFLIVANGSGTTRYQVTKVRYFSDPPDMWEASLIFAARASA